MELVTGIGAVMAVESGRLSAEEDLSAVAWPDKTAWIRAMAIDTINGLRL